MQTQAKHCQPTKLERTMARFKESLQANSPTGDIKKAATTAVRELVEDHSKYFYYATSHKFRRNRLREVFRWRKTSPLPALRAGPITRND